VILQDLSGCDVERHDLRLSMITKLSKVSLTVVIRRVDALTLLP
jgi:hypothetical protein